MFDQFCKNNYFSSRLILFIKITRFDRPIGSLLLLWPTISALVIAEKCGGNITIGLILIFSLGTVLMRSVGCIVNDWVDRDIDKYVRRTRARPITSGKLTGKEVAFIIFVLLACCGFLVLLTNTKTILISLLAVPIVFIYPTLKRYTNWPQAGLGIAFSVGIPMAFTASGAPLSLITLIIFIANFFWVIAYDTIYAMIDRDDDKTIGIGSTAIFFGSKDILAIFTFLACSMISYIILLHLTQHGIVSYLFLITAFLTSCYVLWSMRSRSYDHCLKAFQNSHLYGFIFLLGLITENIILK